MSAQVYACTMWRVECDCDKATADPLLDGIYGKRQAEEAARKHNGKYHPQAAHLAPGE